MTHEAPLAPGATIGILGGGQLGRMLAMAAAKLGLRAHVFCPDPESPAFDVVRVTTVAAYDDEAALARFLASVDVVTYEFENVPETTAAFVAAQRPLYPDVRALATTQDRLIEKTFLRDLGIATADFAQVDTASDLAAAITAFGYPSVLKTRRLGYDGRGQVMIREGMDPGTALASIGGQPAILERFVPFEREVSVVAARDHAGAFAAYEVIENEHENHILKRSIVPAATGLAEAAFDMTGRILDRLGYVGVMAVEMFVVREDGQERLIVNEIAPRVHNSGHWTLEGAVTSQFEQHIRAVAGWPLGATARLGDVEMTNLIGHDADAWAQLAADPAAHLHLYGKTETRPGRKMGHVTRLFSAQPSGG